MKFQLPEIHWRSLDFWHDQILCKIFWKSLTMAKNLAMSRQMHRLMFSLCTTCILQYARWKWKWPKEHFLSAHLLVSFCYLVSNFLLQYGFYSNFTVILQIESWNLQWSPLHTFWHFNRLVDKLTDGFIVAIYRSGHKGKNKVTVE